MGLQIWRITIMIDDSLGAQAQKFDSIVSFMALAEELKAGATYQEVGEIALYRM